MYISTLNWQLYYKHKSQDKIFILVKQRCSSNIRRIILMTEIKKWEMLGGEGGIGDLEEDREGGIREWKGKKIISGDVTLYKYGVSSIQSWLSVSCIQYIVSSILYWLSYIQYWVSRMEYGEYSISNIVGYIIIKVLNRKCVFPCMAYRV